MIITPTSERIARAINAQMIAHHINVTTLIRILEGKCAAGTVRSVKKGSAGASIRAVEQVLDVLGLRIAIIPKSHPDVLE